MQTTSVFAIGYKFNVYIMRLQASVDQNEDCFVFLSGRGETGVSFQFTVGYRRSASNPDAENARPSPRLRG